jgi:hypothetical protein
MPALEVVGEFTLPPPGLPHRAFQALHIDFGLPIESELVDVARFTALYIDPRRPPTSACTRLVLLRRLLSQRAWAEPPALQTRLRDYGRVQRGDNDYVEGILARASSRLRTSRLLCHPRDQTASSAAWSSARGPKNGRICSPGASS